MLIYSIRLDLSLSLIKAIKLVVLIIRFVDGVSGITLDSSKSKIVYSKFAYLKA